MPRFIPTLPQWPCDRCHTLITRTTAYCVGDIYGIIGPKRKVNGAYCVRCASLAAHAEADRQPPRA